MPMSRILAGLCAIVALCTMPFTPAHAGGITGLTRWLDRIDLVRHISFERPTLAPFSYVMFCQRTPEDCRGGATALIAMTPRARQAIEAVNRAVNAAIAPRYDRSDVWTADATTGDCEDYALTKRRALIAAGFPASALSMAVARTRSGEGHAVLVARTSAGDFVLDNRHGALREWHRTDLSILKMASSANPRIWYAVR